MLFILGILALTLTTQGCDKSCGGGYEIRTRKDCKFNWGWFCHEESYTVACNTQPCPIDCVLSGFGPWSACSLSCGLGFMVRQRNVLTYPNFGGRGCENTAEFAACNYGLCNCIMSNWLDWSPCDKSCDGGVRFRTRTIITPAVIGGQCYETIQYENCNLPKCPVDCVLSGFGPWSPCSLSCGVGFMVRHRNIITAPNFGGRGCENTDEFAACNYGPCNCVMSNWLDWAPCDKSCEGGVRFRTRTVITPAGIDGQCYETIQYENCNLPMCPVDCVLSTWSDWAECSNTCNQGTRMRTRNIIVKDNFGGRPCEKTQEIENCNTHLDIFTDFGTCSVSCSGGKRYRMNMVQRPQECDRIIDIEECNTHPCPINCVSKLEEWSDCDKSCGGGIRRRIRTIIVAPENNGIECGPSEEIESCNTCECPVDCVMESYTMWTPCSQSCGGGVRTRSRLILTQSSNGGKICGETIQYDTCNTNPCSIDCLLGAWSGWSECTKSCNGGTMTRSREILVHPMYNGSECGATQEEAICSECKCAVDCIMSEWSEWSGCSKTCGEGLYTSTREINVAAADGGKPCGETSQVRPCILSKCPRDCEYTEWSIWSTCSQTCGSGKQKAVRTIISQSDNGGRECEETTKVEDCNTQPCPVDCILDTWTEFSECDRSCGGGLSFRSRCTLVEPLHGGKPCDVSQESVTCNTKECPIDCKVTGWSTWGLCSVTCGGGIKHRTRKVYTPARFEGKCPVLDETSTCNTVECAIDCVLSAWSEWSQCDATCGTGSRFRSRNIMAPPNSIGKACEATNETEICNTQTCPIDCQFSDWGEWSPCSRSCDSGTTSSVRTILIEAQFGGRTCDDELTVQTSECNTQSCPVDCVLCSWGKWGPCDKSCGSGSQKRSRCVRTSPRNGGKDCGPTTETQVCNSSPCPVDCSSSKWSTWTTCDKSCGAGVRYRYRNFTEPLYGGKTCNGSSSESATCNSSPCPVDCRMSPWSNYTVCSKPCSGGELSRTRNIVEEPKLGGRPCGATYESKPCNTEPCRVVPSS